MSRAGPGSAARMTGPRRLSHAGRLGANIRAVVSTVGPVACSTHGPVRESKSRNGPVIVNRGPIPWDINLVSGDSSGGARGPPPQGARRRETTCRRRTSLQLRVANVRRMQPRPEGGGIPPAEAHPARRVRAGTPPPGRRSTTKQTLGHLLQPMAKSLVIARSRTEAHCSLRTLVAKRGKASAAQTSRAQ